MAKKKAKAIDTVSAPGPRTIPGASIDRLWLDELACMPTFSPMEQMLPSRHLVERTATEIQQRQEQEFARMGQFCPDGAVYRRDPRRIDGPVHVGMVDYSYMQDQTVIAIRMQEHHFQIPVPRGQRLEEGMIRDLAARQARQITRDVEMQIYERLMEVAQRQPRPAPVRPEWVNHAGDIWRGFTEGPREKPEVPEKIEWMDNLPKVIEHGPFKAEIMADTMRLWEESENLRHCLYKSYTKMMQDGRYVAYHVTCPLAKNGFTLGFKVLPYGGPNAPVRYEYDQCKSKGNSVNKDPALLEFQRISEAMLNQKDKRNG